MLTPSTASTFCRLLSVANCNKLFQPCKDRHCFSYQHTTSSVMLARQGSVVQHSIAEAFLEHKHVLNGRRYPTTPPARPPDGKHAPALRAAAQAACSKPAKTARNVFRQTPLTEPPGAMWSFTAAGWKNRKKQKQRLQQTPVTATPAPAARGGGGVRTPHRNASPT